MSTTIDYRHNYEALENLPAPSCTQVHQILSHLTHLCKLDHNSLDLLEPIHVSNEALSHTDLPMNTNCEFFAKRFTSFHNEKIFAMAQSIIARIALIGNCIKRMASSTVDPRIQRCPVPSRRCCNHWQRTDQTTPSQ